ncbi:MAG: hypothetical protein Ct9H300mP11_13780 [Chloroflexota bacterium]|nr:MAG: hypothetical protein Ct9H300mP11_13780 [Chloroflexota bacterium]
MDARALLRNVLVPGERVFLYGDVDMCNNMSLTLTSIYFPGHQVVTKNVVKCEFILGSGQLDGSDFGVIGVATGTWNDGGDN